MLELRETLLKEISIYYIDLRGLLAGSTAYKSAYVSVSSTEGLRKLITNQPRGYF